MLIKPQHTALHQIFCEFLIYSKAVSKSIKGPDDYGQISLKSLSWCKLKQDTPELI